MFGIQALDVVIGMIFIYLLFSLFVTILNEMLGSLINVNSTSIFQTLKDNPEVRAAVVRQATDYFEIEIASSDSSKKDSLSIAELRAEIDSLRTTQIDQLNSSLGLGWEMKQGETLAQEIVDVLSSPISNWIQILGWLITTLALSLGASFWFDMLKKVVNIKSEITKK